MHQNDRNIKILAIFCLMTLISSGRWFYLYVLNNQPAINSILTSIYYGLIISTLGYFTMDLILAKGLLHRKILIIKILFAILLADVLFSKTVMLTINVNSTIFVILKLIVMIFFILGLIYIDHKAKWLYIISEFQALPVKYTQKRPIKTLCELIFRLFSNPEPIGLYKVGKPNPGSPVFVTGNYELTIRRVSKAIHHLDCWLLVCDSRGINIWCASEAGHFGTDKIIDAIRISKLSDYVKRRSLILPQLSASNVSTDAIYAKTGFTSAFGPLNIKHIDQFLNNPDAPGIRDASFNFRERIEVAFSSPITLIILLFIIFNFLGFSHLLYIMPLIYFYNLIQAAIMPKRPVRNIVLWALIYGLSVFLLNQFLFSQLFPVFTLADNLALAIGMTYLVIEFEGWSPLVKFSYGFYKKVSVSVDHAKCIGCKTCTYVCPKSVFKIINGKSTVVAEKACEACRACFVQCPTHAVIHSLDTSCMP